jgi:hypothetical protein
VAGSLPGGDGRPAARDAPGVRQVSCVVHGGLLRAGNGAPGCFVVIGLVVAQRHASGDVSNHGEAYTTNGFLDVPS